MKLQTYREYQPTQFDRKGLGLPDQGDWIVVPVGRNRDSDALGESNFRVAVQTLGGESETVEVHRFGHWACGWFEILIAHPDRRADVEAIAKRLDNYPILNEDDFSALEYERGEAE
jgi:hypothetical protein